MLEKLVILLLYRSNVTEVPPSSVLPMLSFHTSLSACGPCNAQATDKTA